MEIANQQNEELLLKHLLSTGGLLLGFNVRAAIFQPYSDDEHEMDEKMNMK